MAASAYRPPRIARVVTGADIVSRARAALAGAEIIEVASEDTASVQRELDCIVPAIEALIDAGIAAPIAIASRRALVVDRAIEAGAALVCPLEGEEGAEIAEIIALHGAEVVGEPRAI
ncbi:dihydropteroate synthase [Devosia sp. A8/3-2]|nr:dihydropteroate synthase [Devosia sp. A8/3-2]